MLAVLAAGVLLFGTLGLAGSIKSSWSMVIATLLTTLLIQAVEWVSKRHSGWRAPRRKFVTDISYVALSYRDRLGDGQARRDIVDGSAAAAAI